MRIIHIVGDSKWGGGGPILLALGELAKARGWQVDVLTTNPETAEAVRKSGFGVVNIDVIWRPIRPWRDLRGLFHLYGYLRRSGHDIVHTHTSKAGFVGRIAARLAGVPVVLHTVHGFAFHEESNFVTLHFYATLERIAARFCDHMVTVSHHHRNWALKLRICRPSQITAIPNGLASARISRQQDPIVLRESCGISPDERILLTPARLAPQKGIAWLLRSLPLLKTASTVPFRLVVAGDGPLREELKDLATSLGVHDRVTFLGFREDVADLMAASDMVVLPTLYEGLSISLLEAMAARKPIVTTGIESNLEVTRGGDAALIVPPKDPAALASAIASLLNSGALAAEKAERAYQVYEATYTIGQMLTRYWSVYTSLVDSARLAGRFRSPHAGAAEAPSAGEPTLDRGVSCVNEPAQHV